LQFETLSRGTVTASTGATFTTVSTSTSGCSARYVGYCNGLVWAVLLLIAVTIVYFVVVVVAEVVATVNERKAAENAAAAASLSRSNSERPGSMSKRIKAGSGREFSRSDSGGVGPTEQSFNPMFVDGAGAADDSDPAASLKNAMALLEDDTPPNKATWSVVQRWCKEVISQSHAQLAAMADLKRKVGDMELRLAMGGGGDPAPVAMQRGAPTTPGTAAAGGGSTPDVLSSIGGRVSSAVRQLKTTRKRVYTPIALPSASPSGGAASGVGGGFSLGGGGFSLGGGGGGGGGGGDGGTGPRLAGIRGSRGRGGRDGGTGREGQGAGDGEDAGVRVTVAADPEGGETLYT
jgi:hypothetical protein